MYKHQWLEYMEGHERWWDSIWRAAAKRGDQEVRIVGIVMIVIVLVSSSWLWGFSWFVMIVMVVIVIVSSWCHQYDHDVSIIMIVMVMVSFWWLSWICWTFWSLAQIHRLQYFENHCSALLQVTMTPEHGPPNYQVNSYDDMLLEVMFSNDNDDPHAKVCDPRTEKPLADIWDVNHWVALRRLWWAPSSTSSYSYHCHHNQPPSLWPLSRHWRESKKVNSRVEREIWNSDLEFRE